MKVVITTEASVADELARDLEQEPEVEVEGVSDQKDLTEQAFGIAEAAALIAIVKGAVELARALKRLLDKSSADRQTLHLKTTFGSVTIELSKDATLEDLRQLVEPLFTPS